MPPSVFPQPDFPDYELIDSGEAWKLERFGAVVVARPDPQALWRRARDARTWERADLRFEREAESGGRGGRWVTRAGARLPAAWTVAFDGATLSLRPTPFKHVGIFPEQAANWACVRDATAALRPLDGRPRLLDLFGYTGAASAIAARAGWSVTHVEASRTSIAWARENAERSGLADDAVRWVLDDALAFARREARRGARYEGILLDPPHHGRGPKGESWQLESGLLPLVETCGKLLAERGLLVLSVYAVGTSPLALANLLGELGPGEVDAGELALRERGPSARLLPCGFCARFSRGLEPRGAGVA